MNYKNVLNKREKNKLKKKKELEFKNLINDLKKILL